MAIRPKGKKWVVDYWANGSRHRPEFDKRSDAAEFDRQRRLAKTHKIDSVVTISDAIAKYQRDFSSAKVCHSAEIRFFARLEDHLTERCRLKTLAQVEYSHLKSLQIRLLEIKKPATVNRHFRTYKHFFSESIRQGWISRNPCAAVEGLPIASEVRFKPWDEAAQLRLLRECRFQWQRDMAKAFFVSAQRPSTIARWKWSDVDFDNELIHGMQMKGKAKFLHFKIPMTQPLRALLLEIKARGIVGEYVFYNCQGRPVRSGYFNNEMSLALIASGLKDEGYRVYGRRHEVATAVTAKYGIHRAADILGHSSTNTTRKYYAVSDMSKAREALDELFSLDTSGHQESDGNAKHLKLVR